MRRRGCRVLGPYEQHNGWRVVEVDEAGNRGSTIFQTEDEARRHIALVEIDLDKGGRPVSARLTSKPQMIRNKNGSVSWRARVFVDGKQIGRTFSSRDEAQSALDTQKARLSTASKPVVAFKLYAVHADQAETLVAHDTFPQSDWRTYEIDVNGKIAGVWVARLDDVAEPHPTKTDTDSTDGAPF